MKLTLITILLGFGMSAASFGADAFRVYAPSSKTQTLWIVDAVPKVDGDLELKVAEKRGPRLQRPRHCHASEKAAALCCGWRRRTGQGAGSGGDFVAKRRLCEPLAR